MLFHTLSSVSRCRKRFPSCPTARILRCPRLRLHILRNTDPPMTSKELIAAERPRPPPTAPLEGAPETGTGTEIRMETGTGAGTGTGTGIKAGTKTKRKRSTRGGRDRGRSRSRGADTLFPVPTEDLEGPGKTRSVGGCGLCVLCRGFWFLIGLPLLHAHPPSLPLTCPPVGPDPARAPRGGGTGGPPRQSGDVRSGSAITPAVAAQVCFRGTPDPGEATGSCQGPYFFFFTLSSVLCAASWLNESPDTL